MALPTLTIIGNIQKLETRRTQTGKNITSLNLSCGDKNAKGEYDNLYIKAEFWEKQSDFVSQYFKEGDVIIVTGKLVTTNYTKQDGTKVYETKFQFPQASFVPKTKQQDTQTQEDRGYSNSNPQQSTQVPSNGGEYSYPTSQPQGGALPDIDLDTEIPFMPMSGNLYV